MKKVTKKEKSKSKGNTVYSSSEMKHYLGAIAETHNEHLKGIKEGFIVVNKKIDSITETLNEHTEILSEHTEILSGHTEILNEHTKKLDSHTEMIDVLMKDMTIVKEDLSVIKSDLKRKVDYDDFLALVRRVQKIESKI
jgi:chaperonin cofactor prefoldin